MISWLNERSFAFHTSKSLTSAARAALVKDAENRDQILADAKQLQTLGASHGWYTRYARCNGFKSHKGLGNPMHFDHELVSEAHHEMKKDAAHYLLSCNMNTYGVLISADSVNFAEWDSL